jgi:HEAT repeat protein
MRVVMNVSGDLGLAQRLAVGLLLAMCQLVTPSPCQAFDEVIDSPMYHDPDPPAARVEAVFPEQAKALWLKALERPDADTRRRAADAIALARRRGVGGLETAIAPLRSSLDRPDEQATVRLAVAQALIALDARDAAPNLLHDAQAGDGDLRDLVEPALARWDYRPARAVWLARLGDTSASRRDLVLAIQGLAGVREKQAAEPLRGIVLSDRTPAALRLEAAQALGSLRDEGLETDAERLTADTSPRSIVTRLAAVALLRRHRGEKAVGLLQRLTGDPEPAVAAAALHRLQEIDPSLAVPAAEKFIEHPDARLRSLAVEVLHRQPSEKHVRLLGGRLDDEHAEVRMLARRSLAELAGKEEFRERVIEQGTRILAGDRWQGQEQATILLAQLGHKPTASRLVQLLATDRRPEVYITAAWGLRRLAVPDTFPAVVSHTAAQEQRLRDVGRPTDTTLLIDHQVSQLNQLLGEQKYKPADAVLRRFIPRMEKPRTGWMGSECRAAAIWALGRIHEGEPDHDLAAAVAGRLDDINTQPPEEPRVRRMAAITLGRLHAQEALPSLRKHFADHEPSLDPVNNACGWAIEQLTGERLPAPKTIRKMQHDWFLTPFE